MGGGTISTSETRIEALRFQSSAFGAVIPVVFGVTRIPGNLLHYGNFRAIPNTTTTRSGGKGGGGVKQQNTTYTYRAAVMMALCEGPIISIPRVWKGKEKFDGGALPAQIVQVEEPYTVPAGGGTYTVANVSSFVSHVQVYSTTGGGESGLLPTVMAEGAEYQRNGAAYTFGAAQAGRPVFVVYQYRTSPINETAVSKLGLFAAKGQLGQAVWSYLTTSEPSKAIGYSGLAYVAGADYDLGGTAQVDNHNFEVQAQLAYTVNGLPDADPSEVAQALLTNQTWGAGFPAYRLGDPVRWSNYCRASGLLMSPALTEQESAAALLEGLCRLTNTEVVWSDELLKFVPLGDTALSGNGATYTPNVTAVYDLTDDHFRTQVEVRRKRPSDMHNHVRMEFRNRANEYNVEPAEWKDSANISLVGVRTDPTTYKGHAFCEAGAAQQSCALIGQRALGVANTYEFTLPINFSLLEPTDILTLTDPLVGTRVPVMITDVEEDDDGIKITAEDFPANVGSVPAYTLQSGLSFSHNYNADPGLVAAPVFFEAPVERTETGLEIYVAVRGQSANWGGCSLWVSLDNLTYKRVGRVDGPTRYGTVASAIAGGNIAVQGVQGDLLSGSSADADNDATLCYLGGATPEYVSYQTATLTGAGAYTLNTLRRGRFGTTQTPHAAGDAFVRVDQAVGRSGPLDLTLIGKTVWFKFTSFNIYQSAEQSIADVPAYSYSITGALAKLPPAKPTGVGFEVERFGIRLKCNKSPEPDVIGFEWRAGADVNTATVLETAAGTSYLWQVQLAGSFRVFVAAIDALGNYSAWEQLDGSVAAGSLSTLSAAIVGLDLQLDYTGVAGAFAIAGYRIKHGAAWNTGTTVGELVQLSRFVRRADWVGARTWWVAPVDVRGNEGTPSQIDVTITAPGQVQNLIYTNLIDNNAELRWQLPSTGSLPIERYERRRGPVYASAAALGTLDGRFALVTASQPGAQTEWITPIDSAGNVGTPAAVTVPFAAPPDFQLLGEYLDDLTGTATGMVVVNAGTGAAALEGPGGTETWQDWINRGDLTWADRDAAGRGKWYQPQPGSGSYDFQRDTGATIGSSRIEVSWTIESSEGSPVVTPQIFVKLLAGDPWTALTAGSANEYGTNFRYVRVVLTVTGGWVRIPQGGMKITLSLKKKTDSGSFTANAADATGTFVPFNKTFLDVDCPAAAVDSSTRFTFAFTGWSGANPTGFRIFVFDSAGNRVSTSGGWTVAGV
jgi:hypothetical protein